MNYQNLISITSFKEEERKSHDYIEGGTKWKGRGEGDRLVREGEGVEFGLVIGGEGWSRW